MNKLILKLNKVGLCLLEIIILCTVHLFGYYQMMI